MMKLNQSEFDFFSDTESTAPALDPRNFGPNYWSWNTQGAKEIDGDAINIACHQISIEKIDQKKLLLRHELNRDVVEEYTELIQSGASFPPPKVFHDEAGYFLLDGLHRIEAHRQAGETKVEVELWQGSRDDAVRFALSANATHGLRRTNADKRACIRTAIREFPSISDREIARICGVDHKTTGRVRQELTGDFPQLNPEKKTGRDGKSRRVPRRECEGDSNVSNGGTKGLATQQTTDSKIIGASLTESHGRHSENGKTDNSLQILGGSPERKGVSAAVDAIIQQIDALAGSGSDHLDGLQKIVNACTAKIDEIRRSQETPSATGSSKASVIPRITMTGMKHKRTLSVRKRSKKKSRRT